MAEPEHTPIRVLKEQRLQELLTYHSTSKDLSLCRLLCRDLAIQLAPLLFADITEGRIDPIRSPEGRTISKTRSSPLRSNYSE
jgi:hypothetical protein